ncbi:MAG: glycoside hydrolase family 2 TIM barrel-domain containing protein [Flavobacteriales bacterium]
MCIRTLVLTLFAAISVIAANSQVVPVSVQQDANGNWQLMRNGEPYYVRGGGGDTQLDKLVEIGGNSIRTWSTDNAMEVLDEAHKHGLTVMMGLWVQHERHGFDYNNEEKIALQLAGFREVVMKLKDHPALLLWGVGNEVDLFYTNTNVWKAVNDIAAMIHEVDPNHPTCTVTAGLDKEEVRLIKANAPAIDIYGINTYGDLKGVKQGIRDAGWQGPYLITEWGPNGHWEVEKTKWSAPVEQSSTEKADSYESRYRDFIGGDMEKCMGSYVFLWGQKQETTSTWYGLFSESGESCEALDRLEVLWTGKTPSNSCPVLESLIINGMKKGDNITVIAENTFEVSTTARDADQDNLRFDWLIVPESTDIKSGGDVESAPKSIRGSVVSKKGGNAKLRAPAKEGAYRIFLFIRDGHNHYAYANVPVYVMKRDETLPPAKAVSFKKLTLQSSN